MADTLFHVAKSIFVHTSGTGTGPGSQNFAAGSILCTCTVAASVSRLNSWENRSNYAV
jgi:hypothetical protein